MSKADTTIREVEEQVLEHIRARKWDKTTTSRGLAISISLEASELLEYYQWSEENFGDTTDLASEVADIFIYAIQFAHKNNIDIVQAISAKLEKTAKKYPVELFQVEDEAERNKVWLQAKRDHKKETTL